MKDPWKEVCGFYNVIRQLESKLFLNAWPVTGKTKFSDSRLALFVLCTSCIFLGYVFIGLSQVTRSTVAVWSTSASLRALLQGPTKALVVQANRRSLLASAYQYCKCDW